MENKKKTLFKKFESKSKKKRKNKDIYTYLRGRMRNDYDVDDDDDWDLNYQRAKPSNQIDGTFLSKTFFNLISRFCYWKKRGKNADFCFFLHQKEINRIHSLRSFIVCMDKYSKLSIYTKKGRKHLNF